MAEIKVFDSHGVKELKCFDTLSEIDYLQPDLDEQVEDEDEIIDF